MKPLYSEYYLKNKMSSKSNKHEENSLKDHEEMKAGKYIGHYRIHIEDEEHAEE